MCLCGTSQSRENKRTHMPHATTATTTTRKRTTRRARVIFFAVTLSGTGSKPFFLLIIRNAIINENQLAVNLQGQEKQYSLEKSLIVYWFGSGINFCSHLRGQHIFPAYSSSRLAFQTFVALFLLMFIKAEG